MTLEYVLGKNGVKPNVDCTVDTSVQFALMAGAFMAAGGLVAVSYPHLDVYQSQV